jgi:hypothetical protein
VLAGLACAAVLGLALGEISGWPFLRAPLQRAMSKALGVPVQLEGRFGARLLWQPHMLIEHIHVGPAAAFRCHTSSMAGMSNWPGTGATCGAGGKATGCIQKLSAGVIDAHLVQAADGRASWQLGPPGRNRRLATKPAPCTPCRVSAAWCSARAASRSTTSWSIPPWSSPCKGAGQAAGTGEVASYGATVAGRYHRAAAAVAAARQQRHAVAGRRGGRPGAGIEAAGRR